MAAGITVAGLLGTSAIAAMAVVTWLLADALDAVDAQVEEIFGDVPFVDEGMKAGSNSGGGGGGFNATGLRGSHNHRPSSHSGRKPPTA